jgi:hypothetical protein
MSILIELDPATEARRAAEADARGMALAAYAGQILERAASPYPAGTGRLTREGLRELMEKVALEPGTHPELPTSAFSRESFYEGRP